MKFILILSMLVTLLFQNGERKNLSMDNPGQETRLIATIDKADFKKNIQPIFEQKCSPCHFTGGKMFEKMPFDQPATIVKHQEKILRRIKEDPENGLIKEWLKTVDPK